MSLQGSKPASIERPEDNAVRYRPLAERRREPRYATNDRAEVEVVCGGPLRQPARVLDVSSSGLRLEVETFIAKGLEARITLAEHMVIFGEVRYCRRAGARFQAGIAIQSVFHPRRKHENHIHDDSLGLYLIGKGLTAAEIITLREHLLTCESCLIRLRETDAILNLVRRRKLLGDNAGLR